MIVEGHFYAPNNTIVHRPIFYTPTVDLGSGRIHPQAEALQFVVPVDGVLVAHLQGVDGTVRDGPSFRAYPVVTYTH